MSEMSGGELEALPQPPQQSLEDTLPFRGEFVNVSATPEALKSDFVNEATQRGFSQEEAVNFAGNVNFSLESFGSYLQRKAKGSLFKTIISKVARASGQTSVIAGVVPLPGGSYDCFFDIEHIVKAIDKSKTVGQLNIPNDISSEGRQVAVRQITDSVWRHEREHLIDLLDPKKQEHLKKLLKFEKIQHIARTGVMAASMTGMQISSFAFVPDELKMPVLGVSLAGTLAMAADFVTSKPGSATHEKSHFELMKGSNYRTTSPFRVSFSK